MYFVRTNSQHPDFKTLVQLLDAELAIRDGEDHAFYAQYNGIEDLQEVLLAYVDGQAVACGALKTYRTKQVEIKRMYTAQTHRGQGIASQLLQSLEAWAAELDYQSCILETGIRQPEAIHLYHKNGYRLIPNYGQYANVADSRCFAKDLQKKSNHLRINNGHKS